MKKLAYYLLYGFVYVISLLPLWLLYGISDVLFLFVYHIIRYRRKIVRKNISESFPEKTEKEILQIEKKFYHWFCDYIFETFKLLSISDKNLMKRMEYRGAEQLDDTFDKGQDVAAMLGHYCNWEWITSIGLSLTRHRDALIGSIYHGLKNRTMNELFKVIRSSHGGICVNKRYIILNIRRYVQQNRRYLLGYVSDQAPRWQNIHLWLEFFNHTTPVFTGGEKIMRMANNAVYYLDLERPKRGKYICTIKLITDNPKELPEHEVTKRYFKILEQSIRRQPEFYLWTHNRWKRTKEEWEKRNNDSLVNK